MPDTITTPGTSINVPVTNTAPPANVGGSSASTTWDGPANPIAETAIERRAIFWGKMVNQIGLPLLIVGIVIAGGCYHYKTVWIPDHKAEMEERRADSEAKTKTANAVAILAENSKSHESIMTGLKASIDRMTDAVEASGEKIDRVASSLEDSRRDNLGVQKQILEEQRRTTSILTKGPVPITPMPGGGDCP